MFLIATVGALTISLVVTAATFTRGLSALTGLPDNFTVQAFVILLSGGIFCMSSWIGINNGLQRPSKMVGWGAFLLPLVVLLVGPTEFITNNVIKRRRPDDPKLPADEPVYRPARRRRLYPQLDRLLLAVVDLLHPRRGDVRHPRLPRAQNQRGDLGTAPR